MYVCMYVCMYVYIYIHIYIYTYIHTYTYMLNEITRIPLGRTDAVTIQILSNSIHFKTENLISCWSDHVLDM